MSQREPTVERSETVAQRLDPGFVDLDVEFLSGGSPTNVVIGLVGSRRTEVLLRLSLTLTDPTSGPGSDPPSWAALVRNALVHEGTLSHLVRHVNPGIEIDAFLSLLGEILLSRQENISAAPRTQFTKAELDELQGEGIEMSDAPSAKVATNTAVEYSALILRSLSVADAADRLHVDPSRIRQRLAGRSLYGIKSGRTWRLPDFQFTANGQVPGMDQVLPSLPEALHPLAVQRWFETPLRELELDGEPATPWRWLGSGGDPAALVDIAHDL